MANLRFASRLNIRESKIRTRHDVVKDYAKREIFGVDYFYFFYRTFTEIIFFFLFVKSAQAMEDEIIKNTNQIWKKLRSEGGIIEKFRSILKEILVIGFAFSFSIWLNNRAEYRKEQEEVNDFMLILNEELQGDTLDLHRCRREIESALETNKFLITLTTAALDSMKRNNLPVGFNGKPVIRETHRAGYEGFKTSGKLANIENKDLKKMILEYYEVSTPSLFQVEQIYNQRSIKTIDLILDRLSEADKAAFLEKRVQMELKFNIQIGSGLPPSYQNIQTRVAEIQSELKKEMAKRNDQFWIF